MTVPLVTTLKVLKEIFTVNDYIDISDLSCMKVCVDMFTLGTYYDYVSTGFNCKVYLSLLSEFSKEPYLLQGSIHYQGEVVKIIFHKDNEILKKLVNEFKMNQLEK